MSSTGTKPPPSDQGQPAHIGQDEHTETSAGRAQSDDGEEDEEGEEEPRLKYTRLTKSLGGVYRNGDAVSSTLVFGERMILGTHNGNIHVLSLPSLAPLRTYHAHSASVSSISISPPPPPPNAPNARRHKDAISDRNINIATSSIDGLVCVVPLVPSTHPQPGQSAATVPYTKAEITLKNFKRPVLAVSLSPNFQADRMFLSGGLAGNLVLSVAPAGGGSWMTLGLVGQKDTVLHSGEGAITAIAWSRESPRYVAWTNEQGIKIMRSHIVPPAAQKHIADEVAGNPGLVGWIPGLGAGGLPVGEVAWKRISAIERPDEIPEEFASLHKPRLEWIDRRTLLTSEPNEENGGGLDLRDIDWSDKEKLVVGWSSTVWVIDVFEGSAEDEADKRHGWAQITHIFETECVIAGIHLYTPSLLLLLAHVTDDTVAIENKNEQSHGPSEASQSERHTPRTRRGRQNALSPELRFIDLGTSEEVSADELMVSRFEGLSVGDYHLSILPQTPSIVQSSVNEVTGIGASLWAAAINPANLFSSAVSTQSGGGSEQNSSVGVASSLRASGDKTQVENHWSANERGTKIYITSPYDVVFATERSQADHLQWLLERERYQEAWYLIDRHPEVVSRNERASVSYDAEEWRTIRQEYDSDSTNSRAEQGINLSLHSEQEKRRIGELWINALIKKHDWKQAGEVCGRVLGTSSKWEHWVWVFESARKIREITPFIPREPLSPPLPSVIYDIVLAHHLRADRSKFKELLLETWKPRGSRTLYDAKTIVDAILHALDNREFETKTSNQDWRLLQECLAQLYMALGDPKNALRSYVALKYSDEAFKLIHDYRLIDAVSEDVASILHLQVTDGMLKEPRIPELEVATREAMDLLVSEADKGIVSPHRVVSQLSASNLPLGKVFMYFYFRRLWFSDHNEANALVAGPGAGGLLSDFGDLMVELFAEYDRPLLMTFLRESHSYSPKKASAICERRDYIPERVHILSKTGQTKLALFLIIDKLQDVTQAIEFAKAQKDNELWKDLLDYSMDKPAFIRGLLENVGTAIDPITLVRRIPSGLKIEGLRHALGKILKEYGVQLTICDGVAKAMRSEVNMGVNDLRQGQRRGVKFQVGDESSLVPGAWVSDAPQSVDTGALCGICAKPFLGQDTDTLVAFACTHVFHLHCLNTSHVEESRDDQYSDPNTRDVGFDWSGQSVGAKVVHAALIKEKMKNGCQICSERKRNELMV